MKCLALVTSAASLPIDFDMPLLLAAFRDIDLAVKVCDWEDPTIDWSAFHAVLLRSPWNYVDRPTEFLDWCDRVTAVTPLLNPVSAARWSLDKRYLADLAAHGVPTVPTRFVAPGEDAGRALEEFLAAHAGAREIVVKPTVGAYSKDVQRHARDKSLQAFEHAERLLAQGHHVMLQPYLDAVDLDGEADLTFFDGRYSHAITKGAMLLADGTVNVPTQDLRSRRHADDEEREVGRAALEAAVAHLGLDRPLLYGRVDLIRGRDGRPVVLELEICEPSLNLPFAADSARRFAVAAAQRLMD